ncbi:NAD(P)/FAD-dependent oxidoreductase [Sulfurimonas sp.]|uniref:NAD(P)/FAD-dependent oxidoreductase n=1 Tax=Sulfurimonas sp. TaxID=2022749 RepID=UPI0025FE6D36|nr:NAD(P)/FAD-dependent oxidoreductase [Sulfurimonas sp.]
MNKKNTYDVIVIGSGAAGIISAIISAENGNRVLLLEKLPQIASKLKATGGGRCNLTNTLSNEEFISRFDKNARFMRDAIEAFDHNDLINFFNSIGVETHAPDGYRVFPTSHSSVTIIEALKNKMSEVGVVLMCSQKVEQILVEDGAVSGVKTKTALFYAKNIIIATGGLGYPTLGAEGDGYALASTLGHKITELYPAMMPLQTKEQWVKNCKADTIAKVELRVDLQKHKKVHAKGDLIFTNSGIRGPVVLDFAREVTPLLQVYGEVPLLLNLTKGMNEDKILKHLKNIMQKTPNLNTTELLKTLLPEALSIELCLLSGINPQDSLNKISGASKDKLIKTLAWTPLTVVGHDGFKMAMITRGGVDLGQIDPKTMQSKLVNGLYFCGEIMDIDGPCGGYNLQWSFSSGYLAGKLS